MALKISVVQQATLSVAPKDALGNAAAIDGKPMWVVGGANPEAVTLTVAEDGLSALLDTVGVGTAQVQVSADADLGEGVKTISGVLDIEVVAAEAVSLNVEATPADKTPVA